MASTTYTKRLGAINNATVGLHVLGTVPVGKLWVVRDVVMVLSQNNTVKTINGCVLQGASGAVQLAYVGPPNVWEQYTYHWEMRQVLNTGENLSVFAGDVGWCVSVSGYEFTSA